MSGKAGPRAAPPSPAPTLDYDTYVTGMIAWLANRLSIGAAATYRGLFGIGVMEWRVMAHLAIEPGSTGARIGRVIGLDKAAVSRTVATLLHRGLATRVEGAGRGQQWALTDAGAALHARVLASALDREAWLLAPLSVAERTTLRTLLIRLLQHVPPPE